MHKASYSKSDILIGKRLSAIRRYKGKTQTEFARELGLTRAQLVTIESGRVRPPSFVFYQAGKLLNVSPAWLRKGEMTQFPPPFPRLDPAQEANAEKLFKASNNSPFPGVFDAVAANIPSLDNLNTEPFSTDIEIKIPLDNSLNIEKMEAMKIKALMDTVRGLTEKRGEKSALARYCRVSTSQVSNWLAGETEPGGQSTLDLLQWVKEKQAHK